MSKRKKTTFYKDISINHPGKHRVPSNMTRTPKKTIQLADLEEELNLQTMSGKEKKEYYRTVQANKQTKAMCVTTHKPKEELSEYVKAYKKHKEQLYQAKINAEISYFTAKYYRNKDKMIRANQMRAIMKRKIVDNEIKQQLSSKVCIIDSKEKVYRTSKVIAERAVRLGFKYTSKSTYKKYVKETGLTKPGLNPPTKLLRAIERQKQPRKGSGTLNVLQTTLHKGKDQTVDNKGYLLNKKGDRISTKTTYLSKQPYHVYVPIYKRIWEVNPESGRIERVHKDGGWTNNPKEQKIALIVKDGQPVVKRRAFSIKKNFSEYEYTVEKLVKAPIKTITTLAKNKCSKFR